MWQLALAWLLAEHLQLPRTWADPQMWGAIGRAVTPLARRAADVAAGHELGFSAESLAKAPATPLGRGASGCLVDVAG